MMVHLSIINLQIYFLLSYFFNSFSDVAGLSKRQKSTSTKFIVHYSAPLARETKPKYLNNHFITRNNLFFVNNHHHKIPKVDPKTYKLEINFPNFEFEGEKIFDLKEIKDMESFELVSTIQCAGNRRSEMSKLYRKTRGIKWLGSAISTAKWKGVKLTTILRNAGFSSDYGYKNGSKLFVTFEGLDCKNVKIKNKCYGMSIPYSFLVDPDYPAMIAYEMNGKPLPKVHGFPIRVICPGMIGARQVKWLKRIRISTEASQSPWQQKEYRVFPPGVNPRTLPRSDYPPPIYFVPVTSYVTSHKNNQRVKKGPLTLQGYAYAGAGNSIDRVEISLDAGKTWKKVESLETLTTNKAQAKSWAWALWKTKINFETPGAKEIWIKAVDSHDNEEPMKMSEIQNYFGYLTNTIPKLYLKVK